VETFVIYLASPSRLCLNKIHWSMESFGQLRQPRLSEEKLLDKVVEILYKQVENLVIHRTKSEKRKLLFGEDPLLPKKR
jgi:hypothetical protein